MNPITRTLMVLFSWLCLSMIIAFFLIPDISETPLVFIVDALIVAPLIVVLSFTIDILIHKKWIRNHKMTIIIIYVLFLAYVILNFKWIVIVIEDLIMGTSDYIQVFHQ